MSIFRAVFTIKLRYINHFTFKTLTFNSKLCRGFPARQKNKQHFFTYLRSEKFSTYWQMTEYIPGTVNSRFKKDLKLQIHLHKTFFSDDRFLDSLHKSFLNQTTLDLRKEKWTFLN